ncbi:immunity repressor [Microcystis phage Mwe-JY26]
MTVKRRKNAATIVNPRIGALTPEQFKSIGSEVLGGRGWQRSLSKATGWSQSTITRYIQGVLPVPQDVALLLEALATLRRNGLPLPEAFSADQTPEETAEDVAEEFAEALAGTATR